MIIAVIQARTNSYRLPNKAILKIDGKNTLIGCVIDRVKKAKNIDKIILATSKSSIDNPLSKIAFRKKIMVFRGSKNNLIDRFYGAVKEFNPSGILRITGDCPLISPKIIDQLINLFKKSKADYAATSQSYAHGLDAEIFKHELLEDTKRRVKSLKDKEHLTQLMLRNKKIKKVLLKKKETIEVIELL